eukprot:COSAG01_NODE_1073_length_11862_cov_11.086117_2_plen_207_part_00
MVPAVDTLSVQLSGRDQQRVANKNTLQQIRSIYVKLGSLPAMCTAIGSVVAMVPSRYAPRAYKHPDGAAYSVYTDLAIVKPDGRYIKLYIAVDGAVPWGPSVWQPPAQTVDPSASEATPRTSLRNDIISRYRRNLQNRNSAAAGIAIRFGPNILLKCDRRQTGPKYPTTTLDFAYKSSFSLNHYVQSLRPAHPSLAVFLSESFQSL